eukprot:gene50353-7543_t
MPSCECCPCLQAVARRTLRDDETMTLVPILVLLFVLIAIAAGLDLLEADFGVWHASCAIMSGSSGATLLYALAARRLPLELAEGWLITFAGGILMTDWVNAASADPGTARFCAEAAREANCGCAAPPCASGA